MAITFRHDTSEQYGPSLRVALGSADPSTIHGIRAFFASRGCDPFITADCTQLFNFIETKGGMPCLVIIDDRICPVDVASFFRDIRSMSGASKPYVMLIATQKLKEKSCKPDDFLNFPLKPDELEARICVCMRIMELEKRLSEQMIDLASATNKIERLNGLLPICSHCKKIRDDKGYWNELEKYISERTDAEFSHTICPGCLHEHYPEVKDGSF